MYNYQEFDRAFVRERVEQYRDQVQVASSRRRFN